MHLGEHKHPPDESLFHASNRSCRTSLNSYTHYWLFVHEIIMTFHKHSNIWPHSIPNRIGYTQHSTINIINTTDCSIIVHTNIECAAITICKSYN